MKSLIRANFYKLFRTKVYWILFILMPCVNLFSIYQLRDSLILHKEFDDNVSYYWLGWSLSELSTYISHLLYFSYGVMAVIALFVGDEYSSGTIRNKIMAGHSRAKLFFSYFIPSYLGMLLIHFVSEITGLAVCYFKFGAGLYNKTNYSEFLGKEFKCRDLHNDLMNLLKINLTAVIIIASFIAVTLICMTAIGKKAPGFAAAILTDVVSIIYTTDRINDFMMYYQAENVKMEKFSLATLSFDPNGFLRATIYGDYYLPCVICAAAAACVFIAIGAVIMKKRDLK